MAEFNIDEFQTDLQQAVEKNGYDVDLALITSMLLVHEEVKASFKALGVNLEQLSRGLKLELKQQKEALQREKDRKEENYDSDQYEKKKRDEWLEKATSENTHALFDAVRLKATIENRKPTALDVLKEAVINGIGDGEVSFYSLLTDSGRAMKKISSGLHYGDVRTFEELEIDLTKLFPEVAEKAKSKAASARNEMMDEVVSAITEFKGKLDASAPGLVDALLGRLAPQASDGPERRINSR